MSIVLDKRGEGNSKGSDNKSMDFVGTGPNPSATLAPRNCFGELWFCQFAPGGLFICSEWEVRASLW